MITDEDMHQAIDRIARTPEGAVFYRYLQKAICAFLPGEASNRALRQNEGRRSFAAELMGLMAKGIDESGGRTDLPADDAGRASERPVVFRSVPRPVGRSHESNRDWLIRNDPELRHLRVTSNDPDAA